MYCASTHMCEQRGHWKSVRCSLDGWRLVQGLGLFERGRVNRRPPPTRTFATRRRLLLLRYESWPSNDSTTLRHSTIPKHPKTLRLTSLTKPPGRARSCSLAHNHHDAGTPLCCLSLHLVSTILLGLLSSSFSSVPSLNLPHPATPAS